MASRRDIRLQPSSPTSSRSGGRRDPRAKEPPWTNSKRRSTATSATRAGLPAANREIGCMNSFC